MVRFIFGTVWEQNAKHKFACCVFRTFVKQQFIVPFRSVFFRFFREGCEDALSPFFRGGYWGQFQLALWAKARLHHGWVASSGPLLMAVAATQGANCTSGAIWGFSILLKDILTCSSVLPQGSRDSNQRPSDHWVKQLIVTYKICK